MATFSGNASELQRLDWRLLQNGAVTLYFQRAALDPDVMWLRDHAYDVVELDCLGWEDPKEMHRALAAALSFPAYYGMNLDALNDCMSDVDVSEEGGLALAFFRFDAFASRHREVAQAVLDILADNARRLLLFGRRLVVLVQSDDPRITFAPVGATAVSWNPKEWMNKDRGI
ncbi:MAG: barstar family protein [Labilithrix sp.]|nr:barstar family protein [Labilithrix sp.]